MDYVLPDLSRFDASLLSDSYEECSLHAVLFKYDPDEFVLVLLNESGELVFVVPTGYVEACGIRYAAMRTSCASPLTHELLIDMIDALGGTFLEGVLHGYDKLANVFTCYLTVRTGNRIIKVKCRISDAVAVSVVADKALKVNTAFLGFTGA